MPKIDTPVLHEKTPEKVWVSIPLEDNLEQRYPDIIVNGRKYEPGERYFLDAELAGTIESLKKGFEKSIVKLFQSKPNTKAIMEASRSGNTGGGGYVSANSPEFSERTS